MSAIPRFQIGLSHLDARRRREQWQELMPTHELGAFEDQAPPAPATIKAWHLGQMALGPARVGAMRLHRSEAQTRRDQIDHYAFGVSSGGSWTGDARDRDLKVSGDSVFVLGLARPMRVEIKDMDTVKLVIPRDLLDAAIPPRDLHGLTLRGGTAGLPHDHVRALVKRLPLILMSML